MLFLGNRNPEFDMIILIGSPIRIFIGPVVHFDAVAGGNLIFLQRREPFGEYSGVDVLQGV